MRAFRNLPIQKKMLVMTLLICGAVLWIAIAALFIFQILNFRSNFQRDTATLAVIIADHSTAAMAYNDESAAKEIVEALHAKPNVMLASLVRPTVCCWPTTERRRRLVPGRCFRRPDKTDLSLDNSWSLNPST